MTTRDDIHTSETLASADRRPAGAELERLVNAVIWPGFSGRTVPQCRVIPAHPTGSRLGQDRRRSLYIQPSDVCGAGPPDCPAGTHPRGVAGRCQGRPPSGRGPHPGLLRRGIGGVRRCDAAACVSPAPHRRPDRRPGRRRTGACRRRAGGEPRRSQSGARSGRSRPGHARGGLYQHRDQRVRGPAAAHRQLLRLFPGYNACRGADSRRGPCSLRGPGSLRGSGRPRTASRVVSSASSVDS